MPRKPKLMFQICAGLSAGLWPPLCVMVKFVPLPRASTHLGVTRLIAGGTVAGLAPGDHTGQQASSLDALQKFARNFQDFS
jgi:hypothetical protein